jgi:hypothetical protein
MVPKTSLLFAGAALLCLGSASSAQKQDTPLMRRVTQPLQPAQLDLETGTVTRGPAVVQKGAPGYTTCSSLANLDHSGFVGVDSGLGTANGPCEWIESADKGAGNSQATNSGGKSGFVTSFAFAYCSAALDVLSGGPGGFARIGFRTGYQRGSANGGGVTGTDVGTFNLSGLPAWTGCSSFFGGFACYLLNVTFGATPLVLPDGPIGWSYQFRDLGTDGVLAKTFPFLACIQSCTGSGQGYSAVTGGAGPDAMGRMINYVDQYCPAGSLLSSFTFASVPNGAYFTSISMDIREVVPISATTFTFGPGNAQVLIAKNPAIFDGDSFSFDIELDCAGNNNSIALVRVAFAPPPPPIGTKWGIVYVAITAGTGINIGPIPHTGGLLPIVSDIPTDLTLLGACWQDQGFCGNGNVGPNPKGPGKLSNALSQTMGTF